MAARPPSFAEASALSLAMAVVAASHGPLLLLDGEFNVVAASLSFAEVFELDAAAMVGRPLARLGSGEWDNPQLRLVLGATASGEAQVDGYELDLIRPGRDRRALVIHVQRLAYVDSDNPRLLVAIADVTDARAEAKSNADALRQNLILLQEVRHRVANSLQIIASVLLKHARNSASAETRGHLTDAHSRVMSVGALERQLSLTGQGHVELRAYFTQLCDSIAASMISDADPISLTATGTGGVVDGQVSVSLGLIVTELVINALKYAFPDGRPGEIIVNCTFHGPNWILTVCDDGVGMPTDPAAIHRGLGTSIVEALARQLNAVVARRPGHPGTHISITHSQIALVEEGEAREGDEPSIGRASAQSQE